jgi:RNAse (barnase) inhibitor barstar
MTDELSPGVHRVSLRRAEAAQVRARATGGAVARLDGAVMGTEDELFAELATALHFPDYFGCNWDAVSDCLTDLSWLPAPCYLLVVDHADDVLAAAPPAQLEVWQRVLADTVRTWGEPVQDGEWWDRPPVPFTVLLVD